MNAHGVAKFGFNFYYAFGHEIYGSDIEDHALVTHKPRKSCVRSGLRHRGLLQSQRTQPTRQSQGGHQLFLALCRRAYAMHQTLDPGQELRDQESGTRRSSSPAYAAAGRRSSEVQATTSTSRLGNHTSEDATSARPIVAAGGATYLEVTGISAGVTPSE